MYDNPAYQFKSERIISNADLEFVNSLPSLEMHSSSPEFGLAAKLESACACGLEEAGMKGQVSCTTAMSIDCLLTLLCVHDNDGGGFPHSAAKMAVYLRMSPLSPDALKRAKNEQSLIKSMKGSLATNYLAGQQVTGGARQAIDMGYSKSTQTRKCQAPGCPQWMASARKFCPHPQCLAMQEKGHSGPTMTPQDKANLPGYRQKQCQNEDCQQWMATRSHVCPECKRAQAPKGESSAERKNKKTP